MTSSQTHLTQAADILVVDDNINNLRLLTQILTEAGYQVRSAEKPRLAIESALVFPPSLVLLDVMMPEMDGFEVCQQLKAHASTREIPIIFISALQNVEDKVRGFEAGGVDFISKPFQKLEVLARVKTHLQLRDLQLHLEQMVFERTTELRATNKALEEEIRDRKLAEEERDRILRLSQDLICIAGMDGYFKFLNPAWERTLGYTREELLAKPFLNFIHPDDHAKNADEIEKLSAGQPTFSFENRYLHKNGSIRTISWTATPLLEEQMMYCIGRDITDRKLVEEALNESETKYRTLVQQANDGIVVIQDEKIVFANKRFAEISGYTFIAILDTPFIDYLAVEEKPKIALMYQQRMEEETPSISETVIQHRDGSRVEVEFSAGLTSYAGNPAVLVLVRDISGRKQAEEALQASEEQFRQLVEQSPMSIQLMTPAGRVTKVNKAFMTLWGISEDSLPEVLAKYNMLEDEEAKERDVMPLIKKAFKGDSVVLPEIEYDASSTMEVMGVSAKANKRWIQARLYPVKNAKGEVMSVVNVEEDISVRKQAEQDVQEYQLRLKALASQLTIAEERERRRLAAELHDNVGQTLAFARMRLASARKLSSDLKLLTILEESSDSLRDVINETQNLVFDLSSPILNEVGLEAAISEWLEQQVEKRYGLNTEFLVEGSIKPLDEDVKTILFRNVRELLTNVVRHANATKVSVRLDWKEGEIVVVIADNGVGFDPKTASLAVNRESGFGLFSIQERMNDLGGAFSIESKPGQGSKATLSVPLDN